MTGGREVAITGLGLVTPAGTNARAAWEGVCAGQGTASRDPALAGLPVDFSCRIADYDPRVRCPGRRAWQYDRHCQLALTAAAEALADAGLDLETVDRSRVAIVIGTGTGGVTSLLDQHDRFRDSGPQAVSPLLIPQYLPNMAAGQVALHFRTTGPVLAVSTACATGTTALGVAWELLQAGACDIAVAGGTEAALHPLIVTGFHQAGALSTRRSEPAAASRPFDAERDGFVIGEGAAVAILEPARPASARGHPGYALLAGYGTAGDAHHPVAPDPCGRGLELAARRALDAADASVRDVDHVNAHGTGTRQNDAVEAAMISRLYPGEPSVTAVKGVTGHLLGAAGAVEAALAALTIHHGLVPPVANLVAQDPDAAEINAVSGAVRPQQVQLAVSHSAGFGGHNAVLVLRAL